MLVVNVDVFVKAEHIQDFIAATRTNAEASLCEPGIARFDVIQDQSDPSHFNLIEVYRNPGAPAAHKDTIHYSVWRDAVEPWMAKPRSSTKFIAVFPDEKGW